MESISLKHVNIEQTGGVITLTLNDPNTLNALGETMARELRQAVRYAADPQRACRCLVITGAGRAFCSGGNLGMMTGDLQQQRDDPVTLGTHHHYVLKLLKGLPFPVITAVNGAAAGLGFSYALAGDLIVAKQSAFFLAAFSNLGVSSDGGLSWSLPKLIGWARAKELLLLGGRLPAEQALEWGLINRVFPDDEFDEAVAALAQQLAAGPTVSLAALRELAWQSWDNAYEQHLDEEERVQLRIFKTEDAREGTMAMLEKRKPAFKGR